MNDARFLIVNADDFGLSEGINRGVIQAHEHGILTSASLMVRWPAAEEAAAYARSNPSLGVGLHLDLGELAYIGGEWRTRYEVLPVDADEQALRTELSRQITRFQELVGRMPTHIDSHQHRHRQEPLRSIVAECCIRLGVPLREVTPGIRHCGGFYGQSARGDCYPEGISAESLLQMLEALPAGTTELGCHPAAAADFQSTYSAERLIELATLCNPTVRETVSRLFHLIAFHQRPSRSA